MTTDVKIVHIKQKLRKVDWNDLKLLKDVNAARDHLLRKKFFII